MINYSHITPNSMVDGPGQRTVLFLQGCPIACPGCQNRALWPADGGKRTDEQSLASQIMAHGSTLVTISGGEPTEQLDSLLVLVDELRALGAENIIVYSGRTFEWLLENKMWHTMQLMRKIDVLVDGPFVRELDHPLITWRGSQNQRPIDCKATLANGWLAVLDWTNPEIQIDTDGNLHLPVGLAEDFAEVGAVKRSRMCGQTNPIR